MVRLSEKATCFDAGDQVGHLWWRILNGELPVARQPLVYTLLIGTNDLTAADCNKNETELLAIVPGIAARYAYTQAATPSTQTLARSQSLSSCRQVACRNRYSNTSVRCSILQVLTPAILLLLAMQGERGGQDP